MWLYIAAFSRVRQSTYSVPTGLEVDEHIELESLLTTTAPSEAKYSDSYSAKVAEGDRMTFVMAIHKFWLGSVVTRRRPLRRETASTQGKLTLANRSWLCPRYAAFLRFLLGTLGEWDRARFVATLTQAS